ncbi:hypothetical protein FCV25MIE_03493 [Fagus crenata]
MDKDPLHLEISPFFYKATCRLLHRLQQKPVGEGSGNAENRQLQDSTNNDSGSQASEASNGSTISSYLKPKTSSYSKLQSMMKRSPLTAKERLRAARVLNRYSESKATKSEMGNKVLDALRESDRVKKRSRLPEVPTNLFDDSKRGIRKVLSYFRFISSYYVCYDIHRVIVWKVGAIHFNEYQGGEHSFWTNYILNVCIHVNHKLAEFHVLQMIILCKGRVLSLFSVNIYT